MKCKKLVTSLLMIVCILTLTGCQKGEKKDLKDKVNQEISYMSVNLISLCNQLNNISFENYYTTTEEVVKDPGSSENISGNSMESSSKKMGQEESKNPNQNEVSGSESNNIRITSIKSKRILGEDHSQVNWTGLQSDLEIFYSTWNSIIMDLYQIGAKDQDILNFSTKLDDVILRVKEKNKADSLTLLADLYQLIPNFMRAYSENNTMIQLQETRAHILVAYANLEKKDWNVVSDQVQKAEDSFQNVMGDVDFIHQKNYHVNKTYVSLKELQNSIKLKDSDLFFIKYKNFMEEINLL